MSAERGKLSTLSLLQIGIIITVIAVLYLTFYLIYTSSYVSAEAVCVETKRSRKSNYNLYEFTVDGKAYTYRDECTKYSQTKQGDTRIVRYDPKNPDKTFNYDDLGFWIVAFAVGVIFIFSGANEKKKQQRKQRMDETGGYDEQKGYHL